MFYQLLGDGLIMSLFLSGVILIILLAIKANVATYFIILIPMFLGFAINMTTTNIIEFPPWIFYIVYIAFGIIFATMFLINMLER